MANTSQDILVGKALRSSLLKLSYKKGLGHIPSALSMVDYFNAVNSCIDYEQDALVIGKPYGAQAYSVVWGKGAEVKTYGVTSVHPNVTWADSTLGNCLGVAAGLLIGNNYNRIFVNIGDGCIQSGPILSSIAYIGSGKLKDAHKIILCIDANGKQCIQDTYWTSFRLADILNAFGWSTTVFDGHEDYLHYRVKQYLAGFARKAPTAFIFHTKKGNGVPFMEEDPSAWHYRVMTAEDYKRAKAELR